MYFRKNIFKGKKIFWGQNIILEFLGSKIQFWKIWGSKFNFEKVWGQHIILDKIWGQNIILKKFWNQNTILEKGIKLFYFEKSFPKKSILKEFVYPTKLIMATLFIRKVKSNNSKSAINLKTSKITCWKLNDRENKMLEFK